MLKFKHLRWKFTVTCVGLVILSMLVLGVYLLHSLEKYYYHNLENKLTTQGKLISRHVEGMTGGLNLPVMERMVEQFSSDVNARVTIIDAKGVVLGDSEEDAGQMENHLTRPEVQQALAGGTGMAIRYSSTLNSDMMYVAVPVMAGGETTGFVRLAVSLAATRQALFNLWSAVLLAILLAVLITLPVTLTLGKKVTQPLESLIVFARRISGGDYDHRVSIKSSDEIGELAGTLDDMAATIKEQVRQVTEGKNKLEAVLASMTSGVIFVDNKGQINLVNPAAENFLAFMTPGGAGIPHTASVRHPELSAAIDEALKTGRIVERQIKILVPRETVLEVIISPFLGEEGQLNGVVAVLHDITRIRKLEKIRTEFVDNVSHELKTPVTAIKGFTETLLDGAMHQEETCREFIEIIDHEAGRLSRLIQDLLDLSRIEYNRVQARFEIINLVPVIHQTVLKLRGYAENKGLELILDLPGKDVPVRVDRDMIEQVLLNLVDNAVKYTPPRGRVKIELAEAANQVTVWVRDTGAGIPQEDLDRVFERFYRVDKTRSRALGGTGLGLSIVKHIIDLHGGTVGVYSTPGIGSNFYFTLPRGADKK
ncbi:two-component system histidine kinase PnpS [Desulfallas thermosapovorans]|uniref:histidine kinase n=1 Tax=Desulfallas thermosapovorans DSM 6562 TaxID=1121431 RepID=A0A5S4ZP41_9FIRM|nr:ATP-binding protein [Desulfallas thermosapovorans]TYO94618.1 two-component system phosphate regulon sensor histidine kinase PhoR [Desulfallas thermosapovorans DSM 6562]